MTVYSLIKMSEEERGKKTWLITTMTCTDYNNKCCEELFKGDNLKIKVKVHNNNVMFT